MTTAVLNGSKHLLFSLPEDIQYKIYSELVYPQVVKDIKTLSQYALKKCGICKKSMLFNSNKEHIFNREVSFEQREHMSFHCKHDYHWSCIKLGEIYGEKWFRTRECPTCGLMVHPDIVNDLLLVNGYKNMDGNIFEDEILLMLKYPI